MAVKSLSRSGLQASDATNSMLAGYSDVDFELISTAFGNSSAASVTFSNIPQSYKNLQLRIVAQTTSGGPTDLYLRMNNDSTTGNYRDSRLYGFNGTLYSGGVSTNSIYSGSCGQVGDNAPTSAVLLDIVDYTNISKNKTIKFINGKPRNVDVLIQAGSGVWLNTSAISSLTFFVGSGAFSPQTRFSLYGVK
jgi:hypothetical protein